MSDPVGAALAAVVDRADVAEVEVFRLRLPLRRAHRAAHGEEVDREVVLVRVALLDGSTGWGECSALTRPTYSSEYAAGAFAILRHELAPAVLGRGYGGEVVGHPMATTAVVTAHLDATLRSRGTGLADRLGSAHGRPAAAVPTTVVLGRHADHDALLAAVAESVAAGAAAVKLKVSPLPHDLEAVQAVRRTWPALALAVDANGTLDSRSASILGGLDLLYVEQPAPADDLLGSAAMARRMGSPVALDESVTSPAALEVALTMGAATVVNVKPARLGGPLAAADLARSAVDAGCRVFVGGMLETGVGRAAAAALASLPLFDLPTDLGPSERYFSPDVTDPITADANGRLVVPTGPGTGVAPRPDRLDETTVERWGAQR